MKFFKFEAQTSNKIYEILPLEFVTNIMTLRLDFLLKFIRKNNEKKFDAYVNQLVDDFEALVKSTSEEEYKFENIDNYHNVESDLKLTYLHGEYVRLLLGITAGQINTPEKIELPSRIYWRASLLPRYSQLLRLIKVIGRTEAIDLFKQYLDQYYVHRESTFKHYETLDEFFKESFEEASKSTDNEFVVTCSSVENGVLIMRNDNCPAVEALDDIEDRELVFVIICYPDYQWTVMTNEHFVMTRKYTVAEGDPYCDKVFHDKRIDKELKHPSKEFIDSMDSKIE